MLFILALTLLCDKTGLHSDPRYFYVQMPDPIPLRLYKNGILMFEGPFRSYKEPETQVGARANCLPLRTSYNCSRQSRAFKCLNASFPTMGV